MNTKTEEEQEDGDNCIMRNFIACELHHMLLG
jgi:hypothetical protein